MNEGSSTRKTIDKTEALELFKNAVKVGTQKNIDTLESGDYIGTYKGVDLYLK